MLLTNIKKGQMTAPVISTWQNTINNRNMYYREK